MKTILALVTRHLIFIGVSVIFWYLFAQLFGNHWRMSEWFDGARIVHGLTSVVSSIGLHLYWYELKSEGKC